MIVKNESHIIISTLEHLIQKINLDYFVICDTGSSDNTIKLIKNFLKDNKLKGKVYSHDWVNFSHNRNLVLELSKQKADYSFIFDADDKIIGELKLPEVLDKDIYYFKFGETNNYERPLLINNNKQFKWYGVVHEYLKNIDECTSISLDGNYYVDSRRIGSRNNNKLKYFNDAKLLENEIRKFEEMGISNIPEDEKIMYSRSLFYCAQSYKDLSTELDKIYTQTAIDYYERVLSEKSGYTEEKYVSCLYLWRLNNILKRTKVEYLLDSFKYNDKRLECACELLKYCINNRNFTLAKIIYYKFNNYRDINYNKCLFVEQIYYSGYFEYLYSLCGFYNNDLEEGIRCCQYSIENNINVETTKQNLKIYLIKTNQ